MTNQEVQLREYEDSDVDSVWSLHVDGLNQTGTFVYKPELDDDLKDIRSIYLDGSGAFLVALYGSRIVGMGALRNVDGRSAEVKRMRVQVDQQRNTLFGAIAIGWTCWKRSARSWTRTLVTPRNDARSLDDRFRPTTKTYRLHFAVFTHRLAFAL